MLASDNCGPGSQKARTFLQHTDHIQRVLLQQPTLERLSKVTGLPNFALDIHTEKRALGVFDMYADTAWLFLVIFLIMSVTKVFVQCQYMLYFSPVSFASQSYLSML